MTLSHFNPRTREGCDDASPFSASALLDFNPRTREGCDRDHRAWSVGGVDFNPRTREGCDIFSFTICLYFFIFQSTHPRGVRRCRPSEIYGMTWISIHAPARGATLKVFPILNQGEISIHAPARGATSDGA